MSKPKPLRFGALIRVSTEKQADRGESLRTQTKQIDEAVERWGGTIKRTYSGQEHATPDYERRLLDQLLADAETHPRPFDAIIVADESRWSRDNERSKAGLRTLRENGIRFFTSTMEHDLHNPAVRLWLGMSAEIGEYQASVQKEKSAINRINRAKRGLPTCGKLPFGRTYDRETGKWAVDEEKQAMIDDVARRYLAGEPLPRLAEEYGVNHSNLHKVLTSRCGAVWTQTFCIEGLKINETIDVPVPRLLPDETIAAIRRKAEANRTYQHGRPKYPYLLAGYVFCSHCRYSMFGQTNHHRLQYYRHAHTSRARTCGLHPRPWVRCDELDDAVIRHLFELFGNPRAMQRAIENATPNLHKLNELRRRSDRLLEQIEKINRGRDRILKLISNELVTEEQAQSQLQEMNLREATLRDEAQQINAQLGRQPTPDAIKDLAENATEIFRKRVDARPWAASRDWDGMTWDDKRALIQTVFDGTTPDGRPCGVYIDPINGQVDHRRKRWAFELIGHPMVDGEWCVTQYTCH
ncbi:MAG: recombinase family protein [Candidatus Anammoximicrobium sp.]|nr:recombinase family protein [Candidatus Anammoximicrobium sp.]